MAKKLEYYKVTPIERIKDVFEIAVKEAGSKTAFMFRKNKCFSYRKGNISFI